MGEIKERNIAGGLSLTQAGDNLQHSPGQRWQADKSLEQQ